MDPSTTRQAPQGPMTRAHARAIETEVTSLLCDPSFDDHGTWMPPQAETLCILRYHVDDREDTRSEGQVAMKMDLKTDEREDQRKAKTPPRPEHPATTPDIRPVKVPPSPRQNRHSYTRSTSGHRPRVLVHPHPYHGQQRHDIRPPSPDIRPVSANPDNVPDIWHDLTGIA
ncbi:hypothetical protein ZWY2020_043154 [Hordeum vulgare]|nr:hypothetical protein ZWY2020_043154 [Hordeum vulgare]